MNDEWRDEAACIGQPTDWFFPRAGDVVTLRNALATCHRCPVRTECLEAALEEEAHDLRVMGVRGGLSAKQRRMMRGPVRDAQSAARMRRVARLAR